MLGNSIYSNDGVGIVGPNPVALGSALVSNGVVTIQGRLNGSANARHHVELFANDAFDPSGFGEGQRFLGATPMS